MVLILLFRYLALDHNILSLSHAYQEYGVYGAAPCAPLYNFQNPSYSSILDMITPEYTSLPWLPYDQHYFDKQNDQKCPYTLTINNLDCDRV